MTNNFVVNVPYGPAELVEADDWTVTDRTLTFRLKGRTIKQYNNRIGWYSWDIVES